MFFCGKPLLINIIIGEGISKAKELPRRKSEAGKASAAGMCNAWDPCYNTRGGKRR